MISPKEFRKVHKEVQLKKKQSKKTHSSILNSVHNRLHELKSCNKKDLELLDYIYINFHSSKDLDF